jgi:hypothetical protein
MLTNENTNLISAFRNYIRDENVRLAYDILINSSRTHGLLSCNPTEKGVVRDFRFYSADEKQPFAFIINKESLLFYLRLPSVRSGLYHLANLEKIFDSVSVNTREEITIKLFSVNDSRLIVTEVLNKWRL